MKTLFSLSMIVAVLMVTLYKPLDNYGKNASHSTSIIHHPKYLTDSCKTDSLQHTIDSLSRKLFLAEYKIQRVKYYLNIAMKNPSQTKFLKGWIKRAIH
jgi:transposase-like protein